MEISKARVIAEEIMGLLDRVCDRKEIAGSIRRRKPDVGDIEILCVPKFEGSFDCLDRGVQGLIFQGILTYRLNKLGRKVYGPKNKLMLHVPSGIGVDIFSTIEDCWPVSLVVRTGGKQTNLLIATAALQKGYQFHAYGSGFTTPQGEIVCHSEREVFEAVGLPYREPWERD
jgi:DNA polymerase/3'-5' exonuclease PolX